jgi:integrase
VRSGEARALHFEDIDWKNKTVTIHRTFSANILRNRTKSGKHRILPIDNELFEMLKGIGKTTGFVFLNKIGAPYSRASLVYHWKKAIDKSKAQYIRIHEWGRHSFATQAIKRGVPIYALKEWLGHSDIKMTERYINSVTDALKVVQRPGSVINLSQKKKVEDKGEK